jgi:hypothetical protein
MTDQEIKHIRNTDIADYLSRSLEHGKRETITDHLSSCPECLDRMVLSSDSVKEFRKDERPNNRKGHIIKRINNYLALAIIAFSLSFITPRYFLQLLVATLLLGAKWVVDSKTTRMLIMIQEAFKNGGEKEASRVLERLGDRTRVLDP